MPERLLLIRWPRSRWRASRSAAGMSPELAAAMQAVREASPFGLFVDRVGATATLPCLHAFPENVALDQADDAEVAAAMRRWAKGERLEGRHEQRLTIICCTDSRTDACCARFGFATYKALAAAADPALFNVMQCNHLGGCRFATSLAVLPRRERYGRLQPGEVTAFLDAIGSGRPYLPRFRGRADLDEARQSAEIAALRWAAATGTGRCAAVLADAVAQQNGELEIRAEIDGRFLAITLQQRSFLRHGNCSSIGEAPTPMRRWMAVGIRQLR